MDKRCAFSRWTLYLYSVFLRQHALNELSYLPSTFLPSLSYLNPDLKSPVSKWQYPFSTSCRCSSVNVDALDKIANFFSFEFCCKNCLKKLKKEERLSGIVFNQTQFFDSSLTVTFC